MLSEMTRNGSQSVKNTEANGPIVEEVVSEQLSQLHFRRYNNPFKCLTSQSSKHCYSILGGVVIEINFQRAFNSWSKYSHLNPNQIRQLFYFDKPYQQI